MHKYLPTQLKRRKIAGCFDPEHPDELKVVFCLDDEPMALRLKASAFQLDGVPRADMVEPMTGTIGKHNRNAHS